MRYYIFAAVLILFSIISVLGIPILVNLTEEKLISLEIPENNSAVAGIQTYNIPPLSKNTPPPDLSARSLFVLDLGTGTVLHQKDAHIPLPIASTTKIVTALVGSEYFQPNSVLTVNKGAEIGGATVGLVRGENLSFRSLLYGMLF